LALANCSTVTVFFFSAMKTFLQVDTGL
jgi:hypothetical protein